MLNAVLDRVRELLGRRGIAFLFCLLLFSGCALKPGSAVPSVVAAASQPDINPAHAAALVIAAPISKSEPLEETNPSAPNILLPGFNFGVWVTNCWLESSTDSVHWNQRAFTPETNEDGTVGWHVVPDPAALYEIFRGGGETVETDSPTF